MDRANRKKPHWLSASLMLLLAGLTVHTAQAVGTAKATKAVEQSAMEQYRDMSQNERADLANEAAQKSATVTRAATAAERAMMSEKPAQARERLSQRGKTNVSSIAQRSGADGIDSVTGSAVSSPVGKEFRSGNSVGKIVGTAFMHGRKIIRSKDGLHLETCEAGVHAHDAQTTNFLNNIARDSKQGVGRE
jgi:hypothetical protein